MNKERIDLLKEQLNKLLDSNFRTFDNLNDLTNEIGVYSIWKEDEIIYIGKTIDQTLKTRISSILADFRTHTLNNKLLVEMITDKYANKLKEKGILLEKRFHTKEMKEFITKRIFTKEEFTELKKQLRKEIKTDLKIKCLPVTNKKEITSLEHFAIAVKSPKYND